MELLLDKGIDLGLKDGNGRTVMEMMKQFTSNEATITQQKIKCINKVNSGVDSPT